MPPETKEVPMLIFAALTELLARRDTARRVNRPK
jgi:hypothetical protein